MNKKLFFTIALGVLAMSGLRAQVSTSTGTVLTNTSGTVGNVGIGQGTPIAKLHIETSSTTEPGLYVKGGGTSLPLFNLYTANSGYSNLYYKAGNQVGVLVHAYSNPGGYGHSTWGFYGLRHQGSNSGNFQLGGFNTSPTETGYSVSFSASTLWSTYTSYASKKGLFFIGSDIDLAAMSSNSINFSTNATERMRLSSSGYLGIGTATPSYILDVAGGSHRIGNFSWYGDGGGSSMVLNGNPDYPNNGVWGNDTKYAGYFAKMNVNHASGDFTISTSNTAATAAGQFVPNSAMKQVLRVDRLGNLFLGTGGLAISCTVDRFAIGKFANNDGTGAFTPAFSLRNNGTLAVKELCTNPGIVWCDYVFAKEYRLRPLAEVESYIQSNQHLPEIPASADVAKEGLRVSEMLTLQMKKIEELTLYIIAQEKRIQSLENQLEKE